MVRPLSGLEVEGVRDAVRTWLDCKVQDLIHGLDVLVWRCVQDDDERA